MTEKYNYKDDPVHKVVYIFKGDSKDDHVVAYVDCEDTARPIIDELNTLESAKRIVQDEKTVLQMENEKLNHIINSEALKSISLTDNIIIAQQQQTIESLRVENETLEALSNVIGVDPAVDEALAEQQQIITELLEALRQTRKNAMTLTAFVDREVRQNKRINRLQWNTFLQIKDDLQQCQALIDRVESQNPTNDTPQDHD